ncbi:uncharacterized protein LOC109595691 isoform X2 [Aethina tumida]|uniref:uncharacterized protein LOC109595691 isoform X2 n=1 Tax=Aethina tumida TaxID=116153 RepID=UPI0021476464|nr:uncharacterized protein LOC109595691 isoform X2 [Aethina tumida]
MEDSDIATDNGVEYQEEINNENNRNMEIAIASDQIEQKASEDEYIKILIKIDSKIKQLSQLETYVDTCCDLMQSKLLVSDRELKIYAQTLVSLGKLDSDSSKKEKEFENQISELLKLTEIRRTLEDLQEVQRTVTLIVRILRGLRIYTQDTQHILTELNQQKIENEKNYLRKKAIFDHLGTDCSGTRYSCESDMKADIPVPYKLRIITLNQANLGEFETQRVLLMTRIDQLKRDIFKDGLKIEALSTRNLTISQFMDTILIEDINFNSQIPLLADVLTRLQDLIKEMDIPISDTIPDINGSRDENDPIQNILKGMGNACNRAQQSIKKILLEVDQLNVRWSEVLDIEYKIKELDQIYLQNKNKIYEVDDA